MNNQTVAIIISLIVGCAIGYTLFNSRIPQILGVTSGGMMHQMPNGSMMQGNRMQNSMDGMMAGLSGKTGDEFDKVFISEMVMHHEGAVKMAQSALKNAKHQEIKDLANAIITAQTDEIRMMQQWQVQWYK